MQLFTRLAEFRVANEEQRVYKFECEVTGYTRPVFVDAEHVLSPCVCRDDAEHRGGGHRVSVFGA